jgi:hypothetical protein
MDVLLKFFCGGSVVRMSEYTKAASLIPFMAGIVHCDSFTGQFNLRAEDQGCSGTFMGSKRYFVEANANQASLYR